MSLTTVPPSTATVSAYTVSGGLKVAVTARGPLITSAQVPVPEQSPLQPAKLQPGVGATFSVTVLSVAKDAVQMEGQSIPAGLEVTRPLPLTLTATGSCVGRTEVNDAVTA